MTIIAIDPGLNGGIAWKSANGRTHAVSMPDSLQGLKETLNQARIYISPDFIGDRAEDMTIGTCCFDPDVTCFVEDVHAMPGQGVTSMWTFGEHCGTLRGLLYALGIPVEKVQPKTWQKAIGATRPPIPKDATPSQKAQLKAEAKRKIKDIVQSKFPNLKVTLKTADALGILMYATQKTRTQNE